MWQAILKIFAALASYFSNQQLIEAGKAEQQVKQNEADNEARKKAEQIKKNNSALDAESVVVKLRKYKRKD